MILANAGLREELAFCDPRGIPHSHFLGGVPRWTDLDRAKALAYGRIERQTCSSCGTRPDEWAADPDAYTYELRRCEGCARLEGGQEAIEPGRKGMRVGLIPTVLAAERAAAEGDD